MSGSDSADGSELLRSEFSWKGLEKRRSGAIYGSGDDKVIEGGGPVPHGADLAAARPMGFLWLDSRHGGCSAGWCTEWKGFEVNVGRCWRRWSIGTVLVSCAWMGRFCSVSPRRGGGAGTMFLEYNTQISHFGNFPFSPFHHSAIPIFYFLTTNRPTSSTWW